MNGSSSPAPLLDGPLQAMLKSQYHASLAMLRDAIERCPDELWYDDRPRNAFWQIAFHAVYFAHLYLQQNLDSFEPWEHQQRNVQHPDGIPGRADPNSTLPLIPDPYTREQVLDYCRFCDETVDAAVDSLDLLHPESGFYWYQVPKLEHQIVNIRHIQHHTAQLADRLRAATGGGIRWVRAG